MPIPALTAPPAAAVAMVAATVSAKRPPGTASATMAGDMPVALSADARMGWSQNSGDVSVLDMSVFALSLMPAEAASLPTCIRS
jgi:hypothetical protein